MLWYKRGKKKNLFEGGGGDLWEENAVGRGSLYAQQDKGGREPPSQKLKGGALPLLSDSESEKKEGGTCFYRKRRKGRKIFLQTRKERDVPLSGRKKKSKPCQMKKEGDGAKAGPKVSRLN